MIRTLDPITTSLDSAPILIPRRRPLTARVGIFGVGFHMYWPQFPGLQEELLGHLKTFTNRVAAQNVQAIDFGMVDDAQSAYALLRKLKAADLDLVFCNMLTYATSSTFGAIIRELDIPVVLVALQPLARMDYSKATTYMQLCNDNICSLPEFAGVAVRMGKKVPPTIVGTLHDDPKAESEIARWCGIARVLQDVRKARIGHFGHPIEAMLDMHTDPTAITAAFGLHVVQTEVDDLLRLSKLVTPSEVKEKEDEIRRVFDFPEPETDPLTMKLTDEDLRAAAHYAAVLDRFIDEFQLDGLTYYYKGEPGSEIERLASNLIVGNSLLCGAGFPMCSESDLKTCVSMLIFDRLEIGGSFTEFHPVDFVDDFILVGHDGPHHINVAAGRPVLRSLRHYHGKTGRGASVEFKLKEGPITMMSITSNAQGKFKFVIGEGQSVHGRIPATGNTNTRGHFEPSAREFLQRWVAAGPTHHFALGVGHHASTLKQIGDLLGIEAVIV
ncbi:MAG TPA: L-fucose/L-arabinose isomerase family protein [Opitutus sp.]|nr:L-fucose/L-arabinose isomerase family protein [Opitutus sp.]